MPLVQLVLAALLGVQPREKSLFHSKIKIRRELAALRRRRAALIRRRERADGCAKALSSFGPYADHPRARAIGIIGAIGALRKSAFRRVGTTSPRHHTRK